MPSTSGCWSLKPSTASRMPSRDHVLQPRFSSGSGAGARGVKPVPSALKVAPGMLILFPSGDQRGHSPARPGSSRNSCVPSGLIVKGVSSPTAGSNTANAIWPFVPKTFAWPGAAVATTPSSVIPDTSTHAISRLMAPPISLTREPCFAVLDRMPLSMRGSIHHLRCEPVRGPAHHCAQKPESSGFLKAFGRLHSREFAGLGRWQPGADSSDMCSVLPGQRRLGSSACRCADPQPVAVRVAKFDLAPIGWLVLGAAELGHDGVDITHYQVDQGVWPGVTLVLRQEQPRPATRDRHERGHAGLEAVLPLLGESQALIPADRVGSVGDTQDRD